MSSLQPCHVTSSLTRAVSAQHTPLHKSLPFSVLRSQESLFPESTWMEGYLKGNSDPETSSLFPHSGRLPTMGATGRETHTLRLR